MEEKEIQEAVKEQPKKEGLTRRRFVKGVAGATMTYFFSGPGSVLQPKELEGKSSLSRETGEALKVIPENTVMIDFAPQKPVEGIHQSSYPNNERVMRFILGEDYVSPLKMFANLGFTNYRELIELFRLVEGKASYLENRKMAEKVLEAYPKNALARGALEIFADHGLLVTGVREETLARYGYQGSVDLIPIQGILANSEIEMDRDELGNWQLFLDVDPKLVITALEKYPNQKVVNFSFQMGRIGFTLVEKEEVVDWEKLGPIGYAAHYADLDGRNWYFVLPEGADGGRVETKEGGRIFRYVANTGEEVEPIPEKEFLKRHAEAVSRATKVVEKDEFQIRVAGAYEKEEAEGSLSQLTEVARAFPDKSFVVAAGNFRDDLRRARKNLEEKGQWPPNLIIVAEWSDSRKGPRDLVYGADIYVDNRRLGLYRGSSFSTPTISAIVSVLVNNGVEVEKIKSVLEPFCQKTKYGVYNLERRGYDFENTLLLDPEKVDLKK